jgi:hypothetical protein
MKLQLDAFTVRYQMDFGRPAVEVATLGGVLLDRMTANLRIVSGNALSEYSVRIGLYNGFGSIVVTPDRTSCEFRSLTKSADLRVIAETTEAVISAIGAVLPSVAVSREGGVVDAIYVVVGEAEARNDYFGEVVFPGRSGTHRDTGFKTRVARFSGDTDPAVFDVGPLWIDPKKVYVHSEVALPLDKSMTFVERVMHVNDFIVNTLESFQLEIAERP